MTFYIIGIDYKSVSLEAMEAAHRSRSRIAEFWQRANPGRVAVLATCNRVEVYGVAPDMFKAVSLSVSFRRIFKSCFKDAYAKYGYRRVLEHGVSLACGLKSQLKGELQIFRQLEAWFNREDFPVSLKNIWSRIIKAGKEIRAQAGLDTDAVNIANIIFDDIKRNTEPGKTGEIVVIGTGKVASLIAEECPKELRLSFVARKKRPKAEKLAGLSGGNVLSREQMKSSLVTADAVISATSSPHYVLAAGDFADAIRKRRGRLLHVYDVAVPRDIAPGVSEIPFVKIGSLDVLISDFYRRNDNLSVRIELAERLIRVELLENRRSDRVEEDTYRHAAQPACVKAG